MAGNAGAATDQAGKGCRRRTPVTRVHNFLAAAAVLACLASHALAYAPLHPLVGGRPAAGGMRIAAQAGAGAKPTVATRARTWDRRRRACAATCMALIEGSLVECAAAGAMEVVLYLLPLRATCLRMRKRSKKMHARYVK